MTPCRACHDRQPTMTETPPPTPRYELTITITGNTLDEIEHELLIMTRGGFLTDSDRYTRDEWHVISGRSTRIMHHQNPDMTPERYDAELKAWAEARRAARKANR